MLARPTLKRPDEQTESQAAATQAKPAEERFILKVDGQAKRSFQSKDAAVRLGAEIKRKYPIVVVTVTDTADGTSEAVAAST